MQHISVFNKRLLSDGQRKKALRQSHIESQYNCCDILLLHLPTSEGGWGLCCSAFISKEKEVQTVFRGI